MIPLVAFNIVVALSALGYPFGSFGVGNFVIAWVEPVKMD